MLTDSLLSAHHLAVRASVEAVSMVDTADLDRPTPCSEWTLADLLAHMTAQHHGFAAAARGRGADPAAWQLRPSTDPVADHRAAAELLLAAFAEKGLAEREFALPELGTAPFPAEQAVAFHLIDYVVHGWDVARTLGRPYNLHPDIAAPALRIAAQVPDDKRRLAPDAPFAPALPVTPKAEPLARILSILGRNPNWHPPT
jgi:uncharacterized protein (TIGR03086 family)